MFKDKTLLITGGTGSFGNAMLKGFLDSELKEIRIFSRDEKKQEDMRIEYKNEKLNFGNSSKLQQNFTNSLFPKHFTFCSKTRMKHTFFVPIIYYIWDKAKEIKNTYHISQYGI